MIYIIIILSFIFESIFTNIVSINSNLIPLFTIISLSLLYPYFKKNTINYLIVCGITGLFYDLIFTNTPFINTVSFMLISFLVMLNYRLFKYNILSSSIFNIILIIVYRLISYILLVLVGYINFKFNTLFDGISTSIIINIIYGIILYIIIDKLARILDKKK